MLTEATDCDEVIFSEGKKLMEALLSQRNKLVRLIAIGVSRLEKERQLSLWDGGKRERELNRTKDSLRHKYGFNVLEWGRTFYLRAIFPIERGYVLQTPALSR